ncbi:hypothetical protein LTR05_004655 [Lithohypha guttulata]|uniref:Histidine kinase n=1 Tax=Lithohypha guttulata TaxID=1690604 RepID=A0AAN7SZ48_9EURO|nr:hypothetical protein LTR05_004655 [Lithohypha guttulata]
MIGQNAPDVFPDFWNYFEEIITKQHEDGITVSGKASLLLMERQAGFLEETYFDWKLVPVIGDDGLFLGAYGIPTDNTERVIGERRTLCVQNLSQRIAKTTSFDALWNHITLGLLEDSKDVPFALLFADQDALRARGTPPIDQTGNVKLVGSIGVPDGHRLKNLCWTTEAGGDGLPSAVMHAVQSSQISILSTDSAEVAQYLTGIDWKGSGVPCKQLAIMPIFAGARPLAVLVAGINPHRQYNDWYRDFLQHITTLISTQLSALRLSEELKHRAELASKAVKNFERSELRFERFAARSMVGLGMASMHGNILYANNVWCELSGVDPSKAIGCDFRDTIHEDDLPLVEQHWHNAVVLKQVVKFTYRSKAPWRKDEMYLPQRTLYATCYADIDEDGTVETITGLVVDISEQKWTEGQLLQRSRELEESEQRYRSFADLCPFGIVSTDAQGKVKWGNDSWHDFYSFKKGQVVDEQPWLPYVHSDDVDKAKQYFRTLQTTPGAHTAELRLKKKYTIYEGDRMRENDFFILIVGNQEYKDSLKTVIDSIDFWIIDISAQKMAEKILTEKMEEAIRNRTSQEHFIDMISHEIRNPLSALLTCAESICQSLSQIDPQRGPSNGALSVAKGMFTAKAKNEAIYNDILEAANTIIWCSNHQKQIVDDVLTLSKLDSELLVVSPVPVKLTDLMRSALKIFEPELRMSEIGLEMLDHESVALNGINWILLDPNRFLQILINLVTNAIKFTRGVSGGKRIKIVTSIHKERPHHFEELDFVPRRYNPLERRGSTIGPQLEDADQIYLRVSVSDTGKGLSAPEKKLLFNRFAQASPKTHVEYGGSGLGLFISRQITEMLGGEIGVGTSPSGGCTFAFYVITSKIDAPQSSYLQPPIAPAVSRTMSAPVTLLPTKDGKKGNGERTDVEKRKILVVEDNIVNQRVLCKQLRNRGFDVEASNHGKEALAALEKAQASEEGYFDVVLCDIEMPVMDGIQCVQEIRERERDGSLPEHIPVIGVTANVRSKQVDAAVEAGMDGVTTKPYRLDDLIAHIDRLLLEDSST